MQDSGDISQEEEYGGGAPAPTVHQLTISQVRPLAQHSTNKGTEMPIEIKDWRYFQSMQMAPASVHKLRKNSATQFTFSRQCPQQLHFQNGQKSRNYSITNATICLAQSKQVNMGIKNYVWQFKHILGPSFGQQFFLSKTKYVDFPDIIRFRCGCAP